MKVKTVLLFIVVVMSVCCVKQCEAQNYTVTLVQSLSNSYVLMSGNSSALIIDIGDDATSVQALANILNGYEIFMVFITHGHPDHWGGFGGIGLFPSLFPGIPFTVASQAIKNILLQEALNLNITLNVSVEVLNSSVIPWVVPLQVQSSFPPIEIDATSLAYEPTKQYMFSGDVIYVDFHMYLGFDVTFAKVQNWISVLNQVKSNYSVAKLYPGHGAITNGAVGFDNAITGDINYLNNFLTTLCLPGLQIANMSNVLIAQYPTLGGQFVLPFIEGNALAWQTYINSTCVIPSPSPTPSPSLAPSPKTTGTSGTGSNANILSSWLSYWKIQQQ